MREACPVISLLGADCTPRLPLPLIMEGQRLALSQETSASSLPTEGVLPWGS